MWLHMWFHREIESTCCVAATASQDIQGVNYFLLATIFWASRQLPGRNQAEPGRTVRQEKEEHSCNHAQSPKKVFVRGLVHFVPAVAYLFCLNLPAAFSQPRTDFFRALYSPV